MVDNPIHLGRPRQRDDEQHPAQPHRTCCDSRREMGEQRDLQDGEDYWRVHGEASGPTSDNVPCPLPHATARCPVCSVGWIGPGPTTASHSAFSLGTSSRPTRTLPTPRPSDSTRCSWVGRRIPTTGVTTIPSSTVVSWSWSPRRDRLRKRVRPKQPVRANVKWLVADEGFDALDRIRPPLPRQGRAREDFEVAAERLRRPAWGQRSWPPSPPGPVP